MAEGLRNLNPSKCWRYLFSRFVSKQVSSAQVSLTSVFGMGTGGPSPQSTPTQVRLHTLKTEQSNFQYAWQAPAYLLNHSRSSPRLISTGQLHTLLHFHLRPIYVIVYDVPYSSRDERSYLRESFTLRCFQRLSRPHLATQLCRWRDNWCTRGASIPVLSY